MDRLIEGIARFRTDVLPRQRALYRRLAWEGQTPSTLMISCSDSRVVPEVFTQCDPGEIFVTRNAGNVVPPHGAETAGAVASAIEYAVAGLGVQHIVVCGHSDCGAMKALLHPEAVGEMPAVAAWLGHCACARETFRHMRCEGLGDRENLGDREGLGDREAARHLAMANVAAQLQSLRTHPCVAARLTIGALTLHGWFFDIDAGQVLAMDGATGAFSPITTADELPIALQGSPAQRTLAAAE